MVLPITNPLGCQSTDSISVIINNIPIFTLGNYTVQCGGSITLSGPANVQGYLWQDGSVGSTFEVLQTGSYSLQVTDLNGCVFSDSINAAINVLPVFSLGTDVEVCDTLYTINSGFTGSGLLWSDGTTGSTITVSVSGTYFLQITDSNLCSFTDTIAIILLTPVQATFTPNFNNTLCSTASPLPISGGSPVGGSYFVNGNSTTLLVSTVLGPGLFEVSYVFMASNGCSDTADVHLIFEVCSGMVG